MSNEHHVVHEAYGDYVERKNSGNFLIVAAIGVMAFIVGSIMFLGSTGIGEKAVYLIVAIMGLWAIWVAIKDAIYLLRKPKYKDTAQRVSFG